MWWGGVATPSGPGWAADVRSAAATCRSRTTSTTTPGPTCPAIPARWLRPRVFWDDGDGQLVLRHGGLHRRRPARRHRRRHGAAGGRCPVRRGARHAPTRMSVRWGRRWSAAGTCSARAPRSSSTASRPSVRRSPRARSPRDRVRRESRYAPRPGGTPWSPASPSSVPPTGRDDVPQFAFTLLDSRRLRAGRPRTDDVAVDERQRPPRSPQRIRHVLQSARCRRWLRSERWTSRLSAGTGFFGPSAADRGDGSRRPVAARDSGAAARRSAAAARPSISRTPTARSSYTVTMFAIARARSAARGSRQTGLVMTNLDGPGDDRRAWSCSARSGRRRTP